MLLAQISLTLSLSHPSLLAGLLDQILCPYKVFVDKYSLISQHLHICVKGSKGERHL